AAPAPLPPASLRTGLYARFGAPEAPQAAQGHLVADEELPTRRAVTPALPPTETTPANPSRLALPALPAFARWRGVVAATLIVALLAGVFVTLGRGRSGATTGAQPTATVLPQPACAPGKIQANLPEHTLLNDLAMTSPGTGWAVGATPDTLATTTT